MIRKYLFIYLSFNLFVFQCHVTGESDLRSTNELDYIKLKHIPSIIHNNNVYLTVLYKCSSLSKRRISLSIRIEQSSNRKHFAIFRRHWYCQASSNIQTRSIPVHLHRSIAYASDIQSNFQSWPIEHGQLSIIIFEDEQEDENKIIKKIEFDVRFLPVHQRPSVRSIRWNPLIYKPKAAFCLIEPEVVRINNFPLVLTGGPYGKHVSLPAYRDLSFRYEQEMRSRRPKFSIVFWLYIEEYCTLEPATAYCGILQHLKLDNTQLTPELFLNRDGQLVVYMFENPDDLKGNGAHVLASIPKKDWCRIVFVVNEDSWNVSINCLRKWDQKIMATHKSPNHYYYADGLGTFMIGGSDITYSFRGFIGQMDIYRRVALTYEQLPRKPHLSGLPTIISESNECINHLSSFAQCREQLDLFNQRIQNKYTCNALPFRLIKSNEQCLLIRTWKQQLASDDHDVRYRIFRALRRRLINSTNDVANQLFQLITNLLEKDDPEFTCQRVIIWSQQAVCYGHPSAHSLLATLYQFGLCGLIPNSTRTLELLFAGALLNDRISLLSLGHRHFYGLDGIPQDYDSAYVYYRQMADNSKDEYYNPKAGEAAMEVVRLTDNALIGQLTFDKSDSFYWLREQARRGVVTAQHQLGLLLYAGRNGLTRNVQAAVEYFRLAADQHDASSLFIYGLALLTGQGIEKNVTEGLRHIQNAVKQGHVPAQVALGNYAYKTEKNYTKAAKYWQACYDQTFDPFCAHNLGVMWTVGHYPPYYKKDYVRGWDYYSYAAKKGQIDSRIAVAYYNARGGHPSVDRNPKLSAIWSRNVAIESTSLGVIVRRALEAYRDRRWQTSFLFYLQAALAGAELGYFNAGYLCNELKIKYGSSIDCIEQLLSISLMMRENDSRYEAYDLLTIAEYYQSEKNNRNTSIQLYVQLFRDGNPRGLFSLAEMEEKDVIPLDIWNRVGIRFDERIVKDKYRRIQAVYQYCRLLRIPKRDESYAPCTIAYLRISTMIFIHERSELLITITLGMLSIYLSLLLFM